MKTNTDAVLSAKSLRYFLQLIDNMSYTQAAQILGITQPALTQQIKKLERAVGSPLFGQMLIVSSNIQNQILGLFH